MTRKKKVAADTPATVAILIAVMTLGLGKDPESGDPIELPGGEELTAAKIEEFGLTDADVQSLVDSGHLTKIEVRAAGSSAVGENADLATALAENADLKAQLADADKDAKEADEHIDQLEKQVAELTAQLAEATKPKA